MNNNKPKIDYVYGRSFLSDDEHKVAENEIKNFCWDNEIRLVFYRELPDGDAHWREFKVEGPRWKLKKFDDEFCKFVDRESVRNLSLAE